MTKYRIATTYIVSGNVPHEVLDYIFRRRLVPQWNHQVIEATKGSLRSGSNFYADRTEWAEFDRLRDAELCGAKLVELIRKYQDLADSEERDDDA